MDDAVFKTTALIFEYTVNSERAFKRGKINIPFKQCKDEYQANPELMVDEVKELYLYNHPEYNDPKFEVEVTYWGTKGHFKNPK